MRHMTRQQIIDNARQLSRDEQIDLAMELWDIVELREDDFALTDAQKAELDRRSAESDRDPQPAEDVDSLTARLLRGEF